MEGDEKKRNRPLQKTELFGGLFGAKTAKNREAATKSVKKFDNFRRKKTFFAKKSW